MSEPETELNTELASRQVELIEQLAEARRLAMGYYYDIEMIVGSYQWAKHWKNDATDYPWLKDI